MLCKPDTRNPCEPMEVVACLCRTGSCCKTGDRKGDRSVALSEPGAGLCSLGARNERPCLSKVDGESDLLQVILQYLHTPYEHGSEHMDRLGCDSVVECLPSVCKARDPIPRTKQETGSKHRVLFPTQECFPGHCPGKGVQSPLLGVLEKLSPPGKETSLRRPYNSGDGERRAGVGSHGFSGSVLF